MFCSAANVYITPDGSPQGACTNNPQSPSWFNKAANWGSGATQIGAGTTVHLCGTFTGGNNAPAVLTAQGNGSSGNPVTILFESGTTFTASYWSPATGAIVLDNRSYILLDGGTPCGYIPGTGSEGTCNGTIINTANGDNLANQTTSMGIHATGCNYCEVRNLGIYNIYVHAQNGSFSQQASTYCINFNGANWLVHDNAFHDSGFCVYDNYTNDGTSTIYNNDIYNSDHDIVIAGAAYTLQNALIYGNHLHDWANWDCPNDGCHHDGIHGYNGSGGGTTNIYIYNNVFDGNLGSTMNAEIFLEGTQGGTPWTQNGTMYVFNNVLSTSGAHSAAQLWLGSGNLIANNTVVCSGNTGDIAWQNKTATGNLFKNNAEDNCGYFEQWSENYTVANASTDVVHNVYGRCNGYNCWNWDQTGTGGPNIDTPSFQTWQTGKQCDCDSPGNYASTGLNLSSSYVPQSGSPVIGAAISLANSCSGNLAPLCSDITGSPRPSSGAWDAGAYSFSSGQGPQAPTGLVATVQ